MLDNLVDVSMLGSTMGVCVLNRNNMDAFVVALWACQCLDLYMLERSTMGWSV